MLFNDKNQPVTLTNNEIKICIDGKKFQEMKDEGKPINGKMQTTIKMRESILKPLSERKQQANPYGRGLGTAFSLATRARFSN